jgi:hypothetical protein
MQALSSIRSFVISNSNYYGFIFGGKNDIFPKKKCGNKVKEFLNLLFLIDRLSNAFYYNLTNTVNPKLFVNKIDLKSSKSKRVIFMQIVML